MEDTHGNEIIEVDRPEQERKTCQHNKSLRTRPHICPLQAETNDNYALYCHCCSYCTFNCADDTV